MKKLIKKISPKALIFILFSVLFVSSCFKKRIDIDLNENNKRVAVSAWITDLDEPQFVKLSYTTNYLDSKTIAPIKNADVNLESGVLNYTLEEKEDGVYYLPVDWKAEIGKEHTLTININGEVYEAKSVMRPCPAIEDIGINIEEDGEDDKFIEVVFSFDENEGEGDGYFGRDYKKGSIRKDSLSNGTFISDDYIDGIRFDSISVTRKSFELGDTAIVELFSIGAEASSFLQDIENEKFRGGLFDPPPVNIRTNVSNGAVGYFIIGGARREQKIIK